MREDKRRNDQIRPIEIKQGYIDRIKSSVLIEAGRTKVICVASIINKTPAFLKNKSQGWLKVEYSMLPYSSVNRVERESIRGRQSGRTHEIQRLIGRSLRTVIDLSALNNKTIVIDCDVIEADGSTRCVAINGSFIALYNLFLHHQNEFKYFPIKNYIAAVSAGIVDGDFLVDLNYEEDSKAQVDANFVLTEDERIVELQLSTTDRVITLSEFNKLFDLTKQSTKEIISIYKSVLNIH